MCLKENHGPISERQPKDFDRRDAAAYPILRYAPPRKEKRFDIRGLEGDLICDKIP